MEVEVNQRNLLLFEALASKTRMQMVELLKHEHLNIKEMAQRLGISSAIITKHVSQLEEAGVIATEVAAGKRGTQKICTLKLDKVTLLFREEPLSLAPKEQPYNHYTSSIPIGQYSAFQVQPTCGLASEVKLIGMRDDPRYFAEPDHVMAQHLWFASGFVEYRIPNYLTGRKPVSSVRISLEICSEAPGFDEDWLSDITFSLGGVTLCSWTSPGDFGKTKGKLTPSWWEGYNTQHGLLKTLQVKEDGTYMDGIRLSDVTVRDIPLTAGEEIRFRIESPEDAVHPGGVSLFGKRFGNYEQDIVVTIGC
ncbi:helix-turn-helix domain-containing protein [Paenibacillus sp. LHD-117]|uniref:ArsR/SmtB family transcription factor n=1 Tax=Paenibacillus sp. LHD-117 TaxID=3071412 RepID=UPI0027DFCB97|nr:HTH domain-containing protein [Paenibacillus sp. LHD-117]MDQ6419092.1 helix-turn-helix domain-containing protein [Paenibacillus sp. LHD-117]